MAHWRKPGEEIPEEIEFGDRIVVVVHERCEQSAALSFRLVILEANEDGWYSPDGTYMGYTPEDGVLWTTEKDLCGVARHMHANGELP